MKAINPAVELTEGAFQTPSAICHDLYFTGVGGARVYAKFLRPRNVELVHTHLADYVIRGRYTHFAGLASFDKNGIKSAAIPVG
jgi:cephalosporin-C deacetylase-like acetyl esterase